MHISSRLQLDSLYFPMGEREALARSIVRKHDREHLYHCAKQHCGEECTFRAVTCFNPDCHVVISACWVEKHDKVCPRKIVPCGRACGESLARMSMEAHREHSCPLRSTRSTSISFSSIYFSFISSPSSQSPSLPLHLCVLVNPYPIFLTRIPPNVTAVSQLVLSRFFPSNII